jgi:hypothetical protein
MAAGSFSAGWQVHPVIVKLGFLEDAFVRNALINMHAKCGDLGVAGRLLRGQRTGHRGVVGCHSWACGQR